MAEVLNLENSVGTLRERALLAHQEFEELGRVRYEKKETVAELVDAYNAKRVELAKEEMARRRLSWCTYCSELTPRSRLRLMYIEGGRGESFGYGDMFYRYCAFHALHRTCSACRKRMQNRHGTHGPMDDDGNQDKFFAFSAQKKKDGYYANRHGVWVKLNSEWEERLHWAPPDKLVEEISKELGLPNKMKLSFDGCQLVI